MEKDEQKKEEKQTDDSKTAKKQDDQLCPAIQLEGPEDW